uniref:Uncharacterized protein n=1 Tax=Megaselia scalaris TaxID=36166 RepID=T1GAH6_MEGSC
MKRQTDPDWLLFIFSYIDSVLFPVAKALLNQPPFTHESMNLCCVCGFLLFSTTNRQPISKYLCIILEKPKNVKSTLNKRNETS